MTFWRTLLLHAWIRGVPGGLLAPGLHSKSMLEISTVTSLGVPLTVRVRPKLHAIALTLEVILVSTGVLVTVGSIQPLGWVTELWTEWTTLRDQTH